MNQEELLHKIDLFLWKLLPPSEQQAFETEIEQNPSLRETVAQRKLENEVIKQMRRNDLDDKVKGWLEEVDFDKVEPVAFEAEEEKEDIKKKPLTVQINNNRNISPRFWAWGVAASLALLLVATISSIFYYKKNQPILVNTSKKKDNPLDSLKMVGSDTLRKFTLEPSKDTSKSNQQLTNQEKKKIPFIVSKGINKDSSMPHKKQIDSDLVEKLNIVIERESKNGSLSNTVGMSVDSSWQTLVKTKDTKGALKILNSIVYKKDNITTSEAYFFSILTITYGNIADLPKALDFLNQVKQDPHGDFKDVDEWIKLLKKRQ